MPGAFLDFCHSGAGKSSGLQGGAVRTHKSADMLNSMDLQEVAALN